MNTLERLQRYWHTLRYLKPVQIYGRAGFRLLKPKPDFTPAPDRREFQNSFELPARRKPSMTGGASFKFLGETFELDESGWDDPKIEKLFRYNLHYFDDLNAENAQKRVKWHEAIIGRWLEENAAGEGTGWEPYCISLRIINWVKWALRGSILSQNAEHSLAIQARFLMQRLEVHLLGNHLFANAKALVFAGLYFKGDEAERWLQKGLAIIARELHEQVLPDGGHFERSVMYHALAFEDLLDLANIAHASGYDTLPADEWRRVARGMSNWLHAMCHPDGEISFFNDGAMGIAPTPKELARYAQAVLGQEAETPAATQVFSDSGYVRVSHAGAIAFLDVAPVGPDYLPGHAHADTLSMELSIGKERVIVNGGTSRYGVSKERVAERGTLAHSTLNIDGQNSSEVWSGFRVARRAKPFDLELQHSKDAAWVACSHDGYTRLAGKPVHRREWHFQKGTIRVEDYVSNGDGHVAQARFLLHPAVKCQISKDRQSGSLVLKSGRKVAFEASGALSVQEGLHHPEFGRSIKTQCIVIELSGPDMNGALTLHMP